MNLLGILNTAWLSADLIEQNPVQQLTSERTRTMIIHTNVAVLILNDFRKLYRFPHNFWFNDLLRYVSESETGALRKCCVDKTYDPRVLACCQDGILKQHGTCGIWIFLSIKIIQRVKYFFYTHPWSKFKSWKWVCNSLFILLETKYYYCITR